MFNFFNDTGTKIPNNPATIIVTIIDIEIIRESKESWNQTWTTNALIIANIIPFKIPILNSFKIFWLKLFLVRSFVAKVLTVTANVCIPALPPIEATIGIKKASTTICSIVAPNKLIQYVAKKAVNRFNNNQLNLSLLIGISMILNMIVAGLFGILVPVSLKKLNIDPALASSVFVTTITDVIGFLSFLGLGSFYFLN